MKFLRLMMAVALLSCALATLPADANPIVDLDLFHVMALRDTAGERSINHLMQSKASLSFKSPNTGNVRGDVAITLMDSYMSVPPSFTIDRAYLRVRFPKFRLTAGKTRVGWGDGIMFNAADLLFGSTSADASLSNDELRTDTAWLTSVNIPLGAFSFIEALVIPPKTAPYEIRDTALGARYYTTLGSVKLETGGAYRSDDSASVDTGKVLSPYMALQGNFGPDWYAATTVNIAYPTDEIADELQDSWIISGGLYHVMTVGWQGNLSVRLEALIRPFGNWQEHPQQSYGLYLYPEITYAPNETWNFLLRSVISPMDMSANVTAGGSWHVMQGFSLNGYITVFKGDVGDIFSWKEVSPERPSGLSVMVGASWVY